MNKFRELILSVSAEPSIVIHLGAGTCSELDFYQSLAVNRIIFTEPDPELAGIAGNKFIDMTGVSVVTTAVAVGDGQQVLNIANNRRFSSLLTPARLLDFYPNIEIIDRKKVDTTTLEKLCQGAGIDNTTDNLLVIEAQGLEKEIIPATAKHILQSFKWVIIRSSNEDIYKPSKSTGQLGVQQAMRNAHFTVLVFDEDTPPFVNFLCIRNDSALGNEQLKIRETDLLDVIAGFEDEVATLQDQLKLLDDVNKSLLKQVKELSSSIVFRSDELESAREKIQTISAERDKLQKDSSELKIAQSKIAKLSSYLEAERSTVSRLSAENEKLLKQSDNELKIVRSKIAKLSSYLEAERSTVSRLSDENEKLLKQSDNELKIAQSKIAKLSSYLEVERSTVSGLSAENEKLLKQSDNELKIAQSKIAKLSSYLEVERSTVSGLSAENEKLLKQSDNLTNSLRQNNIEFSEMQQTLRINNKLMLKSDTDLKDLQLQYRNVLQHQEQQNALLGELKAKLRQASEFYKSLNLQNLVLDGNMLEQVDSDKKE
jgi:hypothetical protein